MAINEKIEQNIDQSLQNGKRNRYDILYFALADDYEMMKILALYKMQKTPEDIALETKIKPPRIREAIATIDEISRMIDSKVSKIYGSNSREGNRRKNNNTMRIRKKLDKVFLQYIEGKAQGNLKRNDYSKRLDEIAEMVDILQNQTLDMLLLASMYNDLGKNQKAYEIANEYNEDELSDREKILYNKIKQDAILIRNKKFIEDLFESGKTYGEILDICEKQPAEYRAELDMKFIKKVIENYNRRKMLLKAKISQKANDYKTEPER